MFTLLRARGRHPVRGKMDTGTLPNAPSDVESVVGKEIIDKILSDADADSSLSGHSGGFFGWVSSHQVMGSFSRILCEIKVKDLNGSGTKVPKFGAPTTSGAPAASLLPYFFTSSFCREENPFVEKTKKSCSVQTAAAQTHPNVPQETAMARSTSRSSW